MGSRRCIVALPARLASRLTEAQQYKRSRRAIEALFSWAHSTASLLQSVYSNDRVGAFENFRQLAKDMDVILGAGLDAFFRYELRFANCLQSQLLISHDCLLIKQMPPRNRKRKHKRRNQVISGKYPRCSQILSINFYFRSPHTVQSTPHRVERKTPRRMGAKGEATGKAAARSSLSSPRITMRAHPSRPSSVVRTTGTALLGLLLL